MRILLTGANGYIGTRLLTVLAEKGHHVVAMVRSARRLEVPPHLESRVSIHVADLEKAHTLEELPGDIDIAYYLVHSMGNQSTGFSDAEAKAAENFRNWIETSQCQQLIYLSGLAQGEDLSEHMSSRHRVEEILMSSSVPTTVLRAGIIIGAGSASFEILRDLVEKLPLMVAPRWVRSRCQPIAIADVIFYLYAVIRKEQCYNRIFEIGGPEVLTYHQMLMRFAKVRRLKRFIIPVPVLTPRLSSWWLFLVTSTSFPLGRALVDSLTCDAICENNSIQEVFPHRCLPYEEALRRAFVRIEQNVVVSSWKDAVVRSHLKPDLSEYIEVPKHGCLSERIKLPYAKRHVALDTLWAIGGKNGWYYMDWAWKIRGLMDRMCGGIGLRRGRTHATRLRNGDVLDFWRVLLADRENGHLLLFAEMKVPGEAWLEFRVEGDEEEGYVTQTATFRPRGLLGRLYWYALIPAHAFIFHGLCSAVATGRGKAVPSKKLEGG